VSGPIDVKDVSEKEDVPRTASGSVVLVSDRVADVGNLQVRRALPNRGRRTVGSWCFVDHAGPVEVTDSQRPDIGPHPHMGLQTVTWSLAGELLHRDSLGSEQLIRPGQLNLMTAGHGVAHAEEGVHSYRGEFHAVQLWVAQPSKTRHDPPAFEHHAELPQVEVDNGQVTILIGELAGTTSTARRDTDHVGADLALCSGATSIPLDPTYEHALVVMAGAVSIEGETVTPGHLLYLGTGRDEVALSASGPSRMLLLGGLPFEERLLMWWNFVARTRDEIDAGYRDWAAESGRFGRVASSLARMEASRPIWMRPEG
jgi:redox-sensitive bicupin YhaK (pirin superfamily)